MAARAGADAVALETELKFQVPAERAAALRRAVATRGARRTPLQARYYDTPGRDLAAAGIALRLRREDGRWVQTLKARGDGMLRRPEHNVDLGGDDDPAIDVARHAGTPAGAALQHAGVDPAALQPLFATDVLRTHRRLRSGATVVELALDEGVIRAGDRVAPVCELELELVEGDSRALVALARRWVERHALWLDVRSKAERGDLLARGVAASAPVHARSPQLSPHDDPAAALRAMVAVCLEQVLPNASAVAADAAEPEHVHQLRVGLRRLRTALRVFGDGATTLDAGWEPALSALFSRLGAARDADVLSASLLPALRAAGAPLVDLTRVDHAESPGAVVRDPAWSGLMLDLTGFVQEPALDALAQPWALPDAGRGVLVRWVRRRLQRAHRQAVAGAADFETRSEEQQHRVRKRVKRLRYSVEFTASLYPAKAVQRYLKRLRVAQEALGTYNDVLVAEDAFRREVAHDPRAWFALGWLAAQRARHLADCRVALQALAKAEPHWRPQ
jgi:inorganic triphosphatase YgiF